MVFEPNQGWITLVYDATRGAYLPPGRSEIPQGAHQPSLMDMLDTIEHEVFGSSHRPMALKDALLRACTELGVDPAGLAYLQQARKCYEALHGPQIERNPFFTGVSAPERATGSDDSSGPCLTERSDRSHSEREAPPSQRERRQQRTTALSAAAWDIGGPTILRRPPKVKLCRIVPISSPISSAKSPERVPLPRKVSV